MLKVRRVGRLGYWLSLWAIAILAVGVFLVGGAYADDPESVLTITTLEPSGSDVWGIGESIGYWAECDPCTDTCDTHFTTYDTQHMLETYAVAGWAILRGSMPLGEVGDHTIQAKCPEPGDHSHGTPEKTFYVVNIPSDLAVSGATLRADGKYYCARADSGDVTITATLTPSNYTGSLRPDFMHWKKNSVPDYSSDLTYDLPKDTAGTYTITCRAGGADGSLKSVTIVVVGVEVVSIEPSSIPVDAVPGVYELTNENFTIVTDPANNEDLVDPIEQTLALGDNTVTAYCGTSHASCTFGAINVDCQWGTYDVTEGEYDDDRVPLYVTVYTGESGEISCASFGYSVTGDATSFYDDLLDDTLTTSGGNFYIGVPDVAMAPVMPHKGVAQGETLLALASYPNVTDCSTLNAIDEEDLTEKVDAEGFLDKYGDKILQVAKSVVSHLFGNVDPEEPEDPVDAQANRPIEQPITWDTASCTSSVSATGGGKARYSFYFFRRAKHPWIRCTMGAPSHDTVLHTEGGQQIPYQVCNHPQVHTVTFSDQERTPAWANAGCYVQSTTGSLKEKTWVDAQAIGKINVIDGNYNEKWADCTPAELEVLWEH